MPYRICEFGHRIGKRATSYRVNRVPPDEQANKGHVKAWLCSFHWRAVEQAIRQAGYTAGERDEQWSRGKTGAAS